MLLDKQALFAVDAVVSENAAWVLAAGGLFATLLVRAEALYGLWARIRQEWYVANNSQDSVIVKELKEQLAGVKKDQVGLKAEVIDLKSEITMINHEQTQCLLQEERLWGYITLVYDYAARQSSKLEEQGLTVEEIPPMPERRDRGQISDAFRSRTKATNARLAKEVAAIIPIPVPPPIVVPPPAQDKGQP